jgi:addiction module HigA family antidote
MTKLASQFSPDWISAPGETIADLLEERGWSQSDLAKRTGYSPKHVNLLIKGKAPITEDTALKLERVLGSTARFWLTREAQYREALMRTAERISLKRDAEWLGKLPLKDMVRFGWVKAIEDKSEQVAECLKFFGVASVQVWESHYRQPVAAFRSSAAFQRRDGKSYNGAVAAWLRQGEREAGKIFCKPFNKARFEEKLTELRALTNETDPSVFVPKLTALCAEAGVAVVVQPAPKGCPVCGATRWLTPGKALLMLSLRYRSNDQFWFSFFHEAGHLLLHGKRLLFIEIEGEFGGEEEEEADAFARNQLIAPEDASCLAALPKTNAAVTAFARRIGIAPGIVVGRMQKEKYLPWTHLNGLKVRYRWTHNEASHD